MCQLWDSITISDSSYRYELIWSQLSSNRFVSPRAGDSAITYTPRVRNGLMIAANNRTLNLSMLHWSQIYSVLQLSYFAICQIESIPCCSGNMNRKAHLPQALKMWLKQGLIHSMPFGWQNSNLSIIGKSHSFLMTLHSSRSVVVWNWRHLISQRMNHWSMRDSSFVRWLGTRFPADE